MPTVRNGRNRWWLQPVPLFFLGVARKRKRKRIGGRAQISCVKKTGIFCTGRPRGKRRGGIREKKCVHSEDLLLPYAGKRDRGRAPFPDKDTGIQLTRVTFPFSGFQGGGFPLHFAGQSKEALGPSIQSPWAPVGGTQNAHTCLKQALMYVHQ